ncbi:MAG: valine--tRNA ligase [Bacteroidales bacterium]|nr:valine--tRNA ligase [Bacteroidales bacterium]
MGHISVTYNHLEVEEKWYKYWLENNFFRSVPDEREPYTIVIPPPNVTGVLHMGHILNNTIQDILVRRARMKGKNACWVPGTDHASIATEAKVVAKLKEQGINKHDLSREEFLKYAWEWKEKHGNIILEQLKRLGASCDWERTCFTMDDIRSESVIKVFVDLYYKGYIYRGYRMINWDPEALTAISDEEVIYREEKSNLYYVKYYIENSSDYIVVATTRPETILADTGLCVHPNDDRYKRYHGKKVIVPIINRAVPIITDEYVDMEFGTGALKVTPAHDPNDYDLGIKHNLEIINIFTDTAHLNENAVYFIGKDRFEARKLIVEELKKANLLVRIEPYVNKIGYSERTNVVVEPRLSKQWFLKMQYLVKPALENVLNDNIKLIPTKYKNVYKHWMENVKDWCISRQLWWGHRIPVWYLKSNEDEFFVAETEQQALNLARKKYPEITIDDLRQDEDVLDTWFSSWLWPISVFDGIRNPGNNEMKYYYPTNDLITAPEILFFWVARMIMAGYEYAKEKPFKNVYLHGIIRDKLGRKMSKSLGNSPEPLELIQKYGADGVRFGMMMCSPAGNDLLFDETLCEQGRNFLNKIWNAYRLISLWKPDEKKLQPPYCKVATDWFLNKLSQTILNVEEDFEKFRLQEATVEIYKTFWDEFCSWYLEIIKPPANENIDIETYKTTLYYFEELLKLLHPFMPFITEEIWQKLFKKHDNDTIMLKNITTSTFYNENRLKQMEEVKQIITEIRAIRKENNIPHKEKITLYINAIPENYNLIELMPVVEKMANLEGFVFSKPLSATFSFLVGTVEYFIQHNTIVNIDEEINKIKKQIEYYKGFLLSIEKKLSNENFIKKAPQEIINKEKIKKNDTIKKIELLEKQLKELLEHNKIKN